MGQNNAVAGNAGNEHTYRRGPQNRHAVGGGPPQPQTLVAILKTPGPSTPQDALEGEEVPPTHPPGRPANAQPLSP